MVALSELGRLSAGLLCAGILGMVFMLVYLRACDWADWGLMTARARSRVAVVRRQLPALAAGSIGLAGLGLLLGLVDLIGVAQ